MTKPRKVEEPATRAPDRSRPDVRYARTEDVRKATEKIFKTRHDLFRRLAEYEQAHPLGSPNA